MTTPIEHALTQLASLIARVPDQKLHGDFRQAMDALCQQIDSQQQEIKTRQKEVTRLQAELALKTKAALTDGLTQLDNRAFLDLQLEWLDVRNCRSDEPCAIIMLDCDRFKAVNTEEGMAGGDQVLKQIAAILQAHKSEGDIVARYGGEEFVLVLTNYSLENAIAVAQRLRIEIEQTPCILTAAKSGNGARAITASFGVTALQAKESAVNALNRSGLLMQSAKGTSDEDPAVTRNRVAYTNNNLNVVILPREVAPELVAQWAHQRAIDEDTARLRRTGKPSKPHAVKVRAAKSSSTDPQ